MRRPSAERLAKTYSGGRRRRLDLAGALVAGGTSLLLTTQYLEEADVLADNIVVIDHGKIIAEGTADQLKAQVGGECLEITVDDPAQLAAAGELLEPLGVGRAVLDATLQPIMFVLLFVYVFGGAIAVKGGNYKEFLIAGIFAYAFSWVMAMMGLLAPSPEVVNNAAFMVIFLLTFVANTFVPIVTLIEPLRAFAEWNPVSSVTQAARELFGNIPPHTPAPAGHCSTR
jgi:hypothetical protein